MRLLYSSSKTITDKWAGVPFEKRELQAVKADRKYTISGTAYQDDRAKNYSIELDDYDIKGHPPDVKYHKLTYIAPAEWAADIQFIKFECIEAKLPEFIIVKFGDLDVIHCRVKNGFNKLLDNSLVLNNQTLEKSPLHVDVYYIDEPGNNPILEFGDAVFSRIPDDTEVPGPAKIIFTEDEAVFEYNREIRLVFA